MNVQLAASLGAIATMLAAGPAYGQTAPAPATQPDDAAAQPDAGDIIVTAQRRAQRLQDVPIAVAAISATGLARAGVSDLTQIDVAVPGLKITNNNGLIAPRLRGIGSTATGPGVENSIAIYVDGVYFGSTAASLLSLNNVERVEVLKGPQGTLFGRNATGGLLQVITRTPTETPQAEFNVSYGNYKAITANAYIAGGIANHVAMDLAIQYAHQGDGWGRNLGTGNPVYTVDHDFAARSKLVFTPSADTTVTLTGDYSSTDNTLNAVTLLEGTRAFPTGPVATYPGRWDTNTNRDAFTRGWQAGGALTIRQALGATTLTSITAYRKSRYTRAFDFDLTTNPQPNPVPALPYRYFELPQPDRQFSQELQLASAGSGAFTWVLGAYYYNARGGYDPAIFTFEAPFGPVAPQGQVVEITSAVKTESIAGFAQGTLALGARTNLTLGGRFTHETKGIVGSQRRYLIPSGVAAPIAAITPQPDVTIDKFSWRASLDHHVTDDVMAYASFNRGFKSGGFAAGAPGDKGYQPEELDAYEVGIKSQLFDRRLTLNLAGFHYKYTNIQIQSVTASGTITTNGPSARINGIDLDASLRISDAFSLSGGATLVDDKFGTYDNALIGTTIGGTGQVVGSATGNRLPLASRLQLSVSPQYTVRLADGGKIDLSGSYAYNSGWYSEADNVTRQRPFSQFNANVRWTLDGGFSIAAFGKNLSNVRTFASAPTLPGGRHLVVWTPPRTYGVTLGYRF